MADHNAPLDARPASRHAQRQFKQAIAGAARDRQHTSDSRMIPCSCEKFGKAVVIDFGSALGEDLRAQLQVSTYKPEQPTVSRRQCKLCHSEWLVLQEEIFFDIYIARPLLDGEIGTIDREKIWPKDFDNYKNILALGKRTGRSVRFVDVRSPSLQEIVRRILESSPETGVVEVAELLNVTIVDAEALISSVRRDV